MHQVGDQPRLDHQIFWNVVKILQFESSSCWKHEEWRQVACLVRRDVKTSLVMSLIWTFLMNEEISMECQQDKVGPLCFYVYTLFAFEILNF